MQDSKSLNWPNEDVNDAVSLNHYQNISPISLVLPSWHCKMQMHKPMRSEQSEAPLW